MFNNKTTESGPFIYFVLFTTVFKNFILGNFIFTKVGRIV